ncbi:lipopolysaccharide assembly protein LapB [Desulfogranum marinum]|uniref:tetratricopeptide repeat protein n=1 Tax=Desulfogranum marinum TaxID=453220 RepID=UPI00196234CF|nr:tetratricopeptide repeat protein [Desulfogranum marinum]MBM9511148.1 tetratricopeptide repeat protein [Desulfogranum marinum]
MVSDSIQSMDSIRPMTEDMNRENELKNPARRDYMAGRKHFSGGDYTQAVICFHNALLGFEEDGDTQGVANAADRLGDTCMIREEYEMAVKHFKRAAEICEQEDDSFSQTSLHKKMVVAYRKMGEPDNAFELLFDILEHYRLISNPKGVVETLETIGKLYEETGDAANAADTYRTISGIHANFKHERLAREFEERADALK